MHKPGGRNGWMLAALLLAFPALSWAAQPELLPQKTFDVEVDASSSPPEVQVTFALALSDSSNYPVTVTAIGGSAEEVLWDGSLSEGVYRLRAPLTKAGGPGSPLRVVLKTKVTNLSAGTANLIYLKWEGSIR